MQKPLSFSSIAKYDITSDSNLFIFPDPSQLYTLKQIYKAMNASEMETEEIEGSVHALLSSFDIDGQKNIFSLRW